MVLKKITTRIYILDTQRNSPAMGKNYSITQSRLIAFDLTGVISYTSIITY